MTNNDVYLAADTFRRNPHIDRLRAFCILLVMNLHYGFYDGAIPIRGALFNVFLKNGFYAVTIFFVISAFLITSISLSRWGRLSAISLTHFYIMRASRIIPGLVLMLSVLVGLHYLALPNLTIPAPISVGEAVWHALTFRYNYLLGSNNVPGMISWNVLWSLSVEETFYLVFPVVCIALRRTDVLVVAALALIIAAPYNRMLYGNYFLSGVVDSLALGALAALGAAKLARGTHPAWLGQALRITGAAIFVTTFFLPFQANMMWAPLPISLGAALFLLGSGISAPEGKTLRALFRPVEFIGQRSYEIYLFHLPFFYLVNLFVPPEGGMGIRTVHFFIFMTLACLLGELVGRLFTDPLNRKLRRSLTRFFDRESPEEKDAPFPTKQPSTI